MVNLVKVLDIRKGGGGSIVVSYLIEKRRCR